MSGNNEQPLPMTAAERHAAREELLEGIKVTKEALADMEQGVRELSHSHKLAVQAHSMQLNALVTKHGPLFEAALLIVGTKCTLLGYEEELEALDKQQEAGV